MPLVIPQRVRAPIISSPEEMLEVARCPSTLPPCLVYCPPQTDDLSNISLVDIFGVAGWKTDLHDHFSYVVGRLPLDDPAGDIASQYNVPSNADRPWHDDLEADGTAKRVVLSKLLRGSIHIETLIATDKLLDVLEERRKQFSVDDSVKPFVASMRVNGRIDDEKFIPVIHYANVREGQEYLLSISGPGATAHRVQTVRRPRVAITRDAEFRPKDQENA